MDARVVSPRPVASDFGRTLVAVAVAFVVQLVLARIFLELAIAGDSQRPQPTADRMVVTFTVATTTLLTLLVTVYLRRGHESSPRRFVVWIPRVARFFTPVGALAYCQLLMPPAVFALSPLGITGQLAPPVAATWASALLVASLQRRVLHALMIRTRIRAHSPSLDHYDPPPLSDIFSRMLAGGSLAFVMVAAAFMLATIAATGDFDRGQATMVALSLGSCVAFAYLAGLSIGQSPGRDVASIASRLDAIGYDREQHIDQAVVVTSRDEVGTLFFELERLRQRLSRELELYERALSRTRDTEASKAEFLAAVSHELRTPLNSICGFAQLLLDDVPSPLSPPQREDVGLVLAGGHQLLALINDILDISLIESGELSLTFASEDLGELVDEVVRIHSSLVRDKDVVLVVKTPPDLPRTVCDRRRVSQVLTNLLSNAIKFTDEGSIEIHTSYSIPTRRIRVAVKDTGEGIPPDMQQTVFEEYRQARSLKKRAPGTGLGLAIARSIAEHHGGSLSLTSEVGVGSTFTLELPFEPPARPSSIDMTREAARAAHRRQVGVREEDGHE